MRVISALLLTLLLPATMLACLWDYDTLKMERRRFPDALELITGKFLRHSPEFYAWRIQDRQQRLKAEPTNLSLYDDLAVAYEKTGQRALAIETIRKKDELAPGQYETEANLGTFLMLDGQLAEALPHLRKAIEINPDAHFGREKYQLILLEYMLSRQTNGETTLPLAEHELSADGEAIKIKSSFMTFLDSNLKLDPEQPPAVGDSRQQAVKGVLGMMKFADHESPVLLEALGNLLTDQRRGPSDGKQLAARAYLKASYVVKDAEAQKCYRLMAENALSMQRQPNDQGTTLAQVEREFERESEEAATWYAELRAKELQWIEEGKNADAEFDRLYDDEAPTINAVSEADAMVAERSWYGWLAASGVGAVVFLVGSIYVRRRRSRLAKKPVNSPYV